MAILFKENINDICASIQYTLIEMLVVKLLQAADKYQVSEIGIAGGVSANSGLRKRLEQLGQEHNWNIYIPKFEYCTDNAAMIAMAAHYKYLANDFCDQSTSPMPRMKL